MALASLRPVQHEQGKRIPDPGFAGDSGEADPALTAALQAYAGDRGRLPDVLAALHTARVLAPVVAVLGEEETTATGLRVDKSADVALPVLLSPDGARAVPVFSSLETLARWDPAARPVPVPAARAGEVVRAEGAVALLVDLAGPCPATLDEPELRALAEGRGRVPAYLDEDLRVAVHQALAPLEPVAAAWLGPWPGNDARLTVALASGEDPSTVAPAVVAAVRDLLAAAGGGVRGVDVALQPGGEAPPRGGRPVLRR